MASLGLDSESVPQDAPIHFRQRGNYLYGREEYQAASAVFCLGISYINEECFEHVSWKATPCQRSSRLSHNLLPRPRGSRQFWRTEHPIGLYFPSSLLWCGQTQPSLKAGKYDTSPFRNCLFFRHNLFISRDDRVSFVFFLRKITVDHL